METRTETRPLGRYMVIERVSRATGIIEIADSVKQRDMFDFVVVSTGPDCKLGCKPGDIIAVADGMMGYECQDSRKECFIINETDVIGVIEPKPTSELKL
jgi:co-chaperonin GroES (HSP10)